MEKTYRVAIIVGSVRQDSINRKLAAALIGLAPAQLLIKIVEISSLPLYNPDEDNSPPTCWIDFRNQIRWAEAILFVTPEHNRSVPTALKNAIDIGSRPYGESVWDGIPAAIVTASPGAIGGFGANHHLRQSLVFLNMPTMSQPEAYIGFANELFDDQGKLTNEDTQKFLEKFLQSYSAWIDSIMGPVETTAQR